MIFFQGGNKISRGVKKNLRQIKNIYPPTESLCPPLLCVHIKTSSLWAEFVNKNRCISVRLVSEEVKSIKF